MTTKQNQKKERKKQVFEINNQKLLLTINLSFLMNYAPYVIHNHEKRSSQEVVEMG